MLDESSIPDGGAASPDERRAAFQAGWDARLLPILTAEWQSADALAEQLGASKATVLARLKDMTLRELAERRIVKFTVKRPPTNRKKPAKRPRVHTARFEAQFRLPSAG
jgi:imidazolonepropionase-like amidohydrolase